MPVPLHLSAALTDLSATVSQVRGLQQHHAGDVELAGRLRRTAAELESLITHLLHRHGSESDSAPVPRPSTSTSRQGAAEQAFLFWLAEPTSVNELLLAGGDELVPVTQVLGELSLSGRVVPAETAARVGLSDGTTVGRVAAELLLAVNDPAGPGCRSYRAAVYYLRELDRGHLVEPGDGRVC